MRIFNRNSGRGFYLELTDSVLLFSYPMKNWLKSLVVFKPSVFNVTGRDVVGFFIATVIIAVGLAGCQKSDEEVQSDYARYLSFGRIGEFQNIKMSRATFKVLEANPEFCSDENKGLFRRLQMPLPEIFKKNPELVLRDLAVEAVCLDAFQKDDAGYNMAVEVAMLSQTYEFDFEYRELIYSVVASSGHHASGASSAWGYFLLNKYQDFVGEDEPNYLGQTPIHQRANVKIHRYSYIEKKYGIALTTPNKTDP